MSCYDNQYKIKIEGYMVFDVGARRWISICGFVATYQAIRLQVNDPKNYYSNDSYTKIIPN